MANLTNVTKQRQFIIFNFDDGKNVKYDLSTKECIGKRGKVVNSLQSQLSGVTAYDVINLFDDENYSRFLNFVYDKCPYRASSISYVLDMIPHYAKYEQLFSAGIKHISYVGKYAINDIPKGLIKFCRENDYTLNDRLIDRYIAMPHIYNMAINSDYTSLTGENIIRMATYEDYFCGRGYVSCMNVLVEEHNYNLKSLLNYIDYLMTYEGLEGATYIIRELYDYANMAHSMSRKFDKYPRNFLTVHTITSRNYNRLKKEHPEELFCKRIDKSMEKTIGDFTFIYPDTTQDIKDEAVAQCNCVASYIDRVIQGGCHILFMRHKDTPETSLVTIEVRNNKIVQALQRHNARLTEEQQEAVDAWNEWREKSTGKKKERGSMAA